MAVNPKPSAMNVGEWSPNQLAKRALIIKAASQLMVAEGVHSCTARAISTTSGLSTSALHYYFRDIDEIFDLAFRGVMTRFFSAMEAAAAAEGDPVDALWAASSTYLARGSAWSDEKTSTHTRRAPMLWFEYQAESLRSGNLTTVRELSARGDEFFIQLVSETSVSDSRIKAEALYSALLGATIRDSLFHTSSYVILHSLATAIGLPISAKYCEAPKKSTKVKAARTR